MRREKERRREREGGKKKKKKKYEVYIYVWGERKRSPSQPSRIRASSGHTAITTYILVHTTYVGFVILACIDKYVGKIYGFIYKHVHYHFMIKYTAMFTFFDLILFLH